MHPHPPPLNNALWPEMGGGEGAYVLSSYQPNIYYFRIILGNKLPTWAGEAIILGNFNVGKCSL